MCSRAVEAYIRRVECRDLQYTSFIFGLYIHSMDSQLKARSDGREYDTTGHLLTQLTYMLYLKLCQGQCCTAELLLQEFPTMQYITCRQMGVSNNLEFN